MNNEKMKKPVLPRKPVAPVCGRLSSAASFASYALSSRALMEALSKHVCEQLSLHDSGRNYSVQSVSHNDFCIVSSNSIPQKVQEAYDLALSQYQEKLENYHHDMYLYLQQQRGAVESGTE